MISVHRRTPLQQGKVKKLLADFEPADVFGRLIFEWLAEISDAGLELHHCAVFLLTGPPLAGSTDRMFRASERSPMRHPVMMHAPEVIAQLGH